MNTNIIAELTQQQAKFTSREFKSYFKYNSDNSEVINGIFRNNSIRFTQPRVFNDPLEFYPTMMFADIPANYQSYELNGVNFPSVELFFRVRLIESQINKYGILSLTKVPDSFDMWSRYSNGHKGFVIEFKEDFWRNTCMKSKTGEEYPVRKVEYVEDYSVNIEELVDNDNQISLEVFRNELFFKKTSRWNYEEEYRMVRPLSDSPTYQPPQTRYSFSDLNVYPFHFDWDLIASVIMGAAMSIENKSFISKSCQEHHIPLSQAYILRDMKDRFGVPGAVLILSLDEDESKRRAVLNIAPQLFCTDKVRLSNRNVAMIGKVSDLPYYYGSHKEVVDEFYQNAISGGDTPDNFTPNNCDPNSHAV